MKFLYFFLLISFLTSCHTREKQIKQAESYHKIAIGLLTGCNKARALNNLLKAVRLNPKDFLIKSTLGIAYYSMNKKHKAAIEFKKVLKLKPKLTEVRVNLARFYIDTNQINLALSELNQASKDLTYPNHFKLINLKGLAYYKKKDYKKSAKWLREAFSVPQQRHCFVYLNLGKTELALGNIKKAETLFKKSISICKKERPLCAKRHYKEYLALAQLYLKKQNKNKAVYYLRLFLKHKSTSQDAELARRLLKKILKK